MDQICLNSSGCLHWRWLGQSGIGPGTPRELQAVQGVETLGDGAWQIEQQINLMANTSAKLTNTSTNTNLQNCPAHLWMKLCETRQEARAVEKN